MLAIDLGSGEGAETAFLLKNGWQVLAVDGEPGSIEYLMDTVPQEVKNKLQTRVAKFQQVDQLPSADLIHSSYSQPFCPPEYFGQLWAPIFNALKPGGYFVRKFFGPNDSWTVGNPDVTFHSRQEVNQFFEKFNVEIFNEIDEDGQAASGPKHWHVFEVFARKNLSLISFNP